MIKRNISHCRLTVVGVAALALLAPAAVCAADAALETPSTAAPHVMVIAHRGGALLRPENTMPAFRHALKLGVEVLEFDMLMTADGKIVIYHDATINPEFCNSGSTLAGKGPAIRSLTLAETRQFDCGTGVRKAYAGNRHIASSGARIPTLDEVLGGFRDSGALFFAETKIPRTETGMEEIDPVEFATKLNAAVVGHGLEDRLIVQSFDYRTIDALYRINPRIRTCLLGAPKHSTNYQELMQDHHASCIVLNDSEIDAAGVRRLRASGYLVFSGVVDTEEAWASYSALGMDAIFTNDPEGLILYLNKAGLHN